MPAKVKRASGYKYVVTKSGKRKRVYTSGPKKGKTVKRRRVSDKTLAKTGTTVLSGRGPYKRKLKVRRRHTSSFDISNFPLHSEQVVGADNPMIIGSNGGLAGPMEQLLEPIENYRTELPVDVLGSAAEAANAGHFDASTPSYESLIPSAAGGVVSAAGRILSKVIKGADMYGRYRNSRFVQYGKKYVPKGTFKTIGGMVGGPLGSYAGKKFAQLAGFGAYKVNANSILGEGQSPAYMHSSSSSAIIRHREYIGDVTSSSVANAFQINAYPINPGMTGSFPWLQSIAQNYEQYKIRGMVYEYKTMFADAIASSAANSSIGYVIMGTNYNSLAPQFVNKQQMDNTEYTTTCKPSLSFYHPIECEPKSMPTQNLFVRTGAPPANADLRMYDLGLFQIASGGIAAPSVVLGELWCSYEIELIKPVSYSASGFTILSDHFQLDPGLTNQISPLGMDGVPPVSGSSIGGVISGNGTIYSFPGTITDGNYLCIYHVDGGSTATPVVPTITLNNGTLMQTWISDTLPAVSTNGTGTGGKLFLCFIVNVSAVNGTVCQIVFGSGGTYPALLTGGDFFVTQIDADIVT